MKMEIFEFWKRQIISATRTVLDKAEEKLRCWSDVAARKRSAGLGVKNQYKTEHWLKAELIWTLNRRPGSNGALVVPEVKFDRYTYDIFILPESSPREEGIGVCLKMLYLSGQAAAKDRKDVLTDVEGAIAVGSVACMGVDVLKPQVAKEVEPGLRAKGVTVENRIQVAGRLRVPVVVWSWNPHGVMERKLPARQGNR